MNQDPIPEMPYDERINFAGQLGRTRERIREILLGDEDMELSPAYWKWIAETTAALTALVTEARMDERRQIRLFIESSVCRPETQDQSDYQWFLLNSKHLMLNQLEGGDSHE